MRKKAMLPSLGRRWDDAQLLHHAELVKDAPTLNDLAVYDSVYAHPGDSSRLAGRWDAGQFASVRTVPCPPSHDLISFSDLFINREVNVREGVTIARDEHFAAFRAGRHPGQSAWAMVDMVWSDDLIGHGQLPLPKDLLEETAGDSFVRFC
jgi:hypothetical protein